MFMPNRFKITDIKCEKLQDISDNDCLHEGITNIDGQHFGFLRQKEERVRLQTHTQAGFRGSYQQDKS